MKEGIVVKSTGSWVMVRQEDGQKVNCRIRGSLRQKGMKTTSPVAVGDKVKFTLEKDGNGLIEEIAERKNYIIRRSVNLSKREHILAANLDQAVLFVTISRPATFRGFIDRFLVTAEAYHIPAILVFNKIDIYNKKEKDILNEWQKQYEKIGYPCHQCIATDQHSTKNLSKIFENKLSLLSGHSGTGKSTFINTLEPNLDLKTSEVSESHLSGTHTTTFAEMHELKNNILIVDTPGIKGLGVIDIPKNSLSHYFPEFRSLLDQCKFHNCTHINEPGCAIKKALEDGEIWESRYKNYLAIFNSDENESYRTVNY